MTYTVDELNIPNTLLVGGDKGDVFCSKWPKNLVRFTRSEILFSWIPSNAEADSEARILVPVVYSGPHEGVGKGEGESGESVKQMLNSKFQLWAIGA